MPELLEGSRVKLTRLKAEHINELWETAKDGSLWKHYTFGSIDSIESFRKFAEHSINKMNPGCEYTFTITDKVSGKLSGGTSFLDIQPGSKSLEIGRTWIAKELQGTGFNKECKYLLLKYCFEELGLIRVFFKTDSNNTRSKLALESVGAKYEGTLRNHMMRDDGTFRHSAYYSIIECEWADVKKRLAGKKK